MLSVPQTFYANLALIPSPESPSLPYYCDSLPLKGNSSQACSLTVSGNASQHCSSPLCRRKGRMDLTLLKSWERELFIVFSRKALDYKLPLRLFYCLRSVTFREPSNVGYHKKLTLKYFQANDILTLTQDTKCAKWLAIKPAIRVLISQPPVDRYTSNTILTLQQRPDLIS